MTAKTIYLAQKNATVDATPIKVAPLNPVLFEGGGYARLPKGAEERKRFFASEEFYLGIVDG